ncbi:hypothetical protein K0A96_00715 [Patescibacteria group bacterium]|nr:hypothetical protein [Patescibacteria group bacterium]
MEDFEKIESEAIKKIKPQKPKMKISGKSAFLLERLSREKIDKQATQDKGKASSD